MTPEKGTICREKKAVVSGPPARSFWQLLAAGLACQAPSQGPGAAVNWAYESHVMDIPGL